MCTVSYTYSTLIHQHVISCVRFLPDAAAGNGGNDEWELYNVQVRKSHLRYCYSTVLCYSILRLDWEPEGENETTLNSDLGLGRTPLTVITVMCQLLTPSPNPNKCIFLFAR